MYMLFKVQLYLLQALVLAYTIKITLS